MRQKTSGTKVDPLYEGLQIIPSTLSYTQKLGVSNSSFGDATNDPSRKVRPNPRPPPIPHSNSTIIGSNGRTYVNVDPIFDTHILNHARLKSSMRRKKGYVDSSIENYNA